jgi:GNAT superfamily N-acetyltransferase
MTLQIRQARTPAELQAVYRLRYEVYVEELGRVQRYADHETRQVVEPLDQTGRVFCAFDAERLVGTVRNNFARDSDLGEYESLYGMASVGANHPRATSITTKLLVIKDYRSSSLGYRLASAAYADGLAAGIEHNFADVYPARVPFFEKLGYRVHLPEVVHPEYGPVIVMRLDLRDEAHLRAVDSPFLRTLLKRIEAAA